MLSSTIVAEVERLLKESPLSWRKIARRTGVSRGSVHAIAHGRRETVMTLSEYVEAQVFVGKSMLHLAAECENKQRLLV